VVRPHFAFFGPKDAQQTVIIKRMVRDLKMDVEVVVSPIVREEDGLALSSRNVYLSPAERRAALVLYRSLQRARALAESGEGDVGKLAAAMEATIKEEPLARLDYAAVIDGETLEPVGELNRRPVIAAVAAYIGKTRLIDNIILNLTE
jgi:pantoate--beta-alanine ligase